MKDSCTSPRSLSGVVIGRRSQVHIERVKQSLTVVTSSPLLVPSQVPPVGAQPTAPPHLVGSATGIASLGVQAAMPSSQRATGESAFTLPSYVTKGRLDPSSAATTHLLLNSPQTTGQPNAHNTASGCTTLMAPTMASNLTTGQLTLPPSQFLISSMQALPAGYQLPVGSPPPLVPISIDRRPAVGDPFFVCFLHGNISRCNGCKGRIRRAEDKKPLPPPDDIVLRHKEFVIFQNPNSGMFQQTHTPRNVYYHPQRTCVAPHFLGFIPTQHIVTDKSVSARFTQDHLQHLYSEFGLVFD